MVIKSKRQLTEWEKIFANFPSDKRNNNKNMQGAQKTELPKNQWHNEEMDKWTEQIFFKGRSPNV
jgi:hypothetical protein